MQPSVPTLPSFYTSQGITWRGKKSELKLKDMGHSICKQISTQVLRHIFASSRSSHKKLGVVQITFGVINNIFRVKTSSKCMRTALYVLTFQYSSIFTSPLVLSKKPNPFYLEEVSLHSTFVLSRLNRLRLFFLFLSRVFDRVSIATEATSKTGNFPTASR